MAIPIPGIDPSLVKDHHASLAHSSIDGSGSLSRRTASIPRVPLLRMRMRVGYCIDMNVDDMHVDVGGSYSLDNWFRVVFKYVLI